MPLLLGTNLPFGVDDPPKIAGRYTRGFKQKLFRRTFKVLRCNFFVCSKKSFNTFKLFSAVSFTCNINHGLKLWSNGHFSRTKNGNLCKTFSSSFKTFKIIIKLPGFLKVISFCCADIFTIKREAGNFC